MKFEPPGVQLSENSWGARGGLMPPRPEGAATAAHIIGDRLKDQAPPKA